MKKIFISLLTAALLTVSACSDKTESGAPAKPKVVKHTILKLNGKSIDNAEFIDFAYFAVSEMDPVAAENEEIKDRLLKNFVIHRLLLAEAQLRGIDMEEEQKNKVYEYIDALEKGRAVENGDNSSDEEIKNRLKKQMLENLLVQKLLSDVADTSVRVGEEELKTYYDAHKENFTSKKTANVMMILTFSEEKAKEAQEELKKGVPFSEVAGKYSETAERNNGGSLGYVTAEDYPDVFSEAFKLKAGETSKIIKSEYGFHIFRVLDYKTLKRKSFDDVKSDIYAKLYSDKQEESVRNFIDEIYKKAEIINVAPASFKSYTGGSGADN
jgi:parvulin-like peptidyl-prolyl isomerase